MRLCFRICRLLLLFFHEAAHVLLIYMYCTIFILRFYKINMYMIRTKQTISIVFILILFQQLKKKYIFTSTIILTMLE